MLITKQSDAQRVFNFFEEISKIPRASQNSDKIADYLENFAKSRGLFFKRDRANNVIIRKAATEGYENAPTVIFQSHTDIVADKINGSSFDFDTDGLEILRDGDFLHANGTTLGADDGIGVAYSLALLDSKDVPHPEFEALFTSDEEIGLLGAAALDTSFLRGKILINLDSDEEGVFTVGCAGGGRLDITLPYKKEKIVDTALKIKLSGLTGGHSGVEIDKCRENAIKLLASTLSLCGDVMICDFCGGSADNAIPRFAECTLYTNNKKQLSFFLKELEENIRKKEPDLLISTEEDKNHTYMAYSARNSAKILELLCKMPTGVYKMSEDIPELVETSSNLGIIDSSGDRVKISVSIRSSKDSEKDNLHTQINSLALGYGAETSMRGEYPAWEYKKDLKLVHLAKKTYIDIYKKEPKIVTIHAGLECGVFTNKIDGLQCISLGPDNFNIHTTEERLSISSTVRVWDYLKALLKNMNAPAADWR